MEFEVRFETKCGVLPIIMSENTSPLKTETVRFSFTQNTHINYPYSRCFSGIVSEYSCMTGISPSPPGMADKDILRSINYHRSCVVLTQPGAKLCWWLAFFKNERPLSRPNIPRYTIDDHETILKRYGSDRIGASTLNEIYETAHHKVLVPVEEFTLEKWYFKRIVLLGDSCHKIHPIIGQGANQAIESAACLADLLRGVALENSHGSNDAIGHAFNQYHAIRYNRALSVMHAGRFAQCIDSLDTWWFKYLALYKVIKKPIGSGLLPSFANMVLPAVSLKGLPQPQHPGNVLYEDQIRIKPCGRSQQTTRVYMLGFALVSGILWYKYFGLRLIPPQINKLDLYFGVQYICINAIWVIESYRLNISALIRYPIHIISSQVIRELANLRLSILPFIAIAIYSNLWEIPFALYSGWYIYQSAAPEFYYPSPRAIDVGAAMSLPYSVILAYAAPIYLTVLSEDPTHLPWIAAHLILPMLAYSLSILLHKTADLPTGVKIAFTGDLDIPHLKRYYNIVFLIAASTHILTLATQYKRGDSLITSTQSFWTIALVIVAFLVFTLWDLKRVNIFVGSLSRVSVLFVLGMVVFGPGAILIESWKWRETTIERARKEKKKIE